VITTAIEPPRQAELLELLRLGDEYAHSLYPAENSFLLDIAELEAAGVFVFVSRNSAGTEAAGAALGMAALVVAPPPAETAAETAGGATRTAELKRLFVLESARGLGVARALMAAVESEARASGVTRLLLETGPQHHAALALYTGLGDGHIPQFGQYIGAPDSVCMAKQLT
jgi:putative acetyltransferase